MTGRLGQQRFQHAQRFGGAALLQPQHADHLARFNITGHSAKNSPIELFGLVKPACAVMDARLATHQLYCAGA
jgi:hypothetical protein